jgi:C4-dicarboxylate-specific signal transduction histidine kinase
MGWIASWFVTAGLSQRRARQLAFGLLALLLLIGLWLGKLLYDRALITRHDAVAAAVQATADRAADASAATRRRTDDARLEAEADALERITDNEMVAADPLAARRRFYDCVRLQQQARAAGHLTPAC